MPIRVWQFWGENKLSTSVVSCLHVCGNKDERNSAWSAATFSDEPRAIPEGSCERGYSVSLHKRSGKLEWPRIEMHTPDKRRGWIEAGGGESIVGSLGLMRKCLSMVVVGLGEPMSSKQCFRDHDEAAEGNKTSSGELRHLCGKIGDVTV